MTVSVVVTAHNEAAHIAACLQSIQAQTLKPSEVLLVAHNCTDKTAEIARSFRGVTVLELAGPAGCAYAREHGFRAATGDVIASIDGDATANEHWLEAITHPLARSTVAMTGGVVWLRGSAFGWLKSFDFFYLRRWFVPGWRFYPWGPNFACRRSDFVAIDGLKPLFELKPKLQLNEWPDDLYLSLKLAERGRIAFVPTAKVTTFGDEVSPARARRQTIDRKKLTKAVQHRHN